MGKSKTSKRKMMSDFHKIKKKIQRIGEMLDVDSSSSSSSQSTSSDSEDQEEMRCQSPELKGPVQSDQPKSPRIEEILGVDPTKEKSLGPDILEDLSTRWTNYLTKGLDNDTKSKLIEKWQTPQNCQALNAPKLNAEIMALLGPSEIRKEGFLCALQETLGRGITAVGSYITKNLQNKDNQQDFSDLVEAGKILGDVHHTISVHRKYRLKPFLNQSVQKVVQKSKIDNHLFGDDFGEQYKLAKTVENTANELKAQSQRNSSLNFKRSLYKTKMKKRPEELRHRQEPKYRQEPNTYKAHPFKRKEGRERKYKEKYQRHQQ